MNIGKIKLDEDGCECECPRCESKELVICNDDGVECFDCGLWFAAFEDGTPRFVYSSHPMVF